MAKTFSIIKQKNLVSGEERAVKFTAASEEKDLRRITAKLNRRAADDETSLYSYRLDEELNMHLLSNIAEETVRDLSSHIFHTAYAVCKKTHASEQVLYLSLFKDTALKFWHKIPAAYVTVNKKRVLNPKYYVKELTLAS